MQAALRLLQARHDDVQSVQALMATMGLSQLVLTEPDARDTCAPPTAPAWPTACKQRWMPGMP